MCIDICVYFSLKFIKNPLDVYKIFHDEFTPIDWHTPAPIVIHDH